MQAESIKEVKIESKEYPNELRKIANPPKALYVRGNLIPDELLFAIVGTRKCSNYGRQVVLDIAGKLADAGITIVSGLAPGIDTLAHQACVDRKKRTIAVLGTGINERSIYPQTNLALTRKILENNGCLMSELPPGTPGSKITFPNRNRIISGLSIGVLVIEAKRKSGSLITADYAKRQGKKIFSVPGPIYSSNSAGCHKLIKEGAKLVDNANDILQELNLPLHGGSLTQQLFSADSSEEKVVIKALSEEPLHIDKIIETTRFSAMQVASILAVLEIKERVRNLGGNVYGVIN